MINIPGLGGSAGNPNFLPRPPAAANWTWLEQYAASSKSDVASGLQLVSTVAGHGNVGKAAIASPDAIGGTFKVYIKISATDLAVGASQGYGFGIMVRDSVHGPALWYDLSCRSGAISLPTHYNLRIDPWKGIGPGDGSSSNRDLCSGNTFAPWPPIIMVSFDGSGFGYWYGNTPSSLTQIGSDTLATVRAWDGFSGAWAPNQVGLLSFNADGPPGNPGTGTNTHVISGWKVTA